MPMKLRDGKLYTARPTSQILLRDGKVVNHNQAKIAGISGVINENESTQDSPRKQRGTPTKGHFFGTEARSLRSKGRASPRLTMTSNFVQYESNAPRKYISSEQDSSFSKETLDFTETTIKKPVKKNGRKNPVQISSTKQIPRAKEKMYKNVMKDTSYSIGDSFITSTPMACVSNQYDGDTSFANSFVLSDRETRTVEDGEDLHDSELDSFSRIIEKSRNRNRLETPVNRHIVSASNDRDQDESIEDSIFEDLSKPVIYSKTFNYMSDVDSPRSPPNRSTNMSFSYFDAGASPSVSLNHARWSRHHHWRREWYLNRWSLNAVRTQSKRWLQSTYVQVISILISIQTFFAAKISAFQSIINSIWYCDVKRQRRRRAVFVYHKGHHISRISEEVDEEDAAAFCTIFVTRILLCVIMFLLIGFLLWPHNISFGGSPIFNLTKHGMKNVRYLKFSEHQRVVPSWHVLPVGVAEKSNVKNKFPVTFYIHNTYDKSITKQIEIFKVLSSTGYNVIIPIYPDCDLVAGWKGMCKLFGDSPVVLWGEKGVGSDMQELAKELCKEGFPPAGVVIETEQKFDKSVHVKELEVWTCNCTTTRMSNGLPFSYSHVKCPLEIDNLSKDIVHCLQALG